jgi:prepilin-type N-terminal cleavage/methylation domain-containing protein
MRPASDAGFTLVELLVALTIGTIVVGVLGQAVAIGLKTTTSTATTLVDAVHSRALTSDLLTDIGSAKLVGTSTTAPPCGANPAPAGTVLWTQDPDDNVEYYAVTDIPADPAQNTPAFSQLKRGACTGAPVQLASWVQAVAPAPPRAVTVECEGRPECGGVKHLTEALTAASPEVKLDDIVGFPDPNDDVHAVQPYKIIVGDESMTVIDRTASTLKVSRPSGEEHSSFGPNGDGVTYLPANVSITVPRADSAACDTSPCAIDADPYTLTVSPGAS